jgi:putative membrane protein (TIGR04086 family)
MENRKDQKPDIQKEAVWILKSLLGAYVVTGILLLLLALFVYKLNLEEKQVTVAVMAIYLVSTFVGGFMIGKWNRVQKFLWGMIVGAGYFILLLLVSFGIYHSLKNGGGNVITTMFLCIGGGLLGGMLA